MSRAALILGCVLLTCPIVAVGEAAEKGLVAHYPFEEGRGGVTADATDNVPPATIYGAGWVRDEFGTALEFNGAGDYVDCGADPALDVKNTTVAAWVLPRATGGGIVGTFMGGGWHDLRFVLSYGTWGGERDLLWVLANPGAMVKVRSDPPPEGQWVHVAATADGKTLSIYLNGKLAAAAEQGGVAPLTQGVPMKIGVSAGLGIPSFRGLIDDVKIYDRALAASEIAAQYAAQREGRKPPLATEKTASFNPERDTWLDSAHPNHNYGASTGLAVGRNNRGQYAQALLRFDPLRVPHTSLVVSARLRVYTEQAPTGALKIGAYRMIGKWNEGAKRGAPATRGEPTLRHQLVPAVPWAWRHDRDPAPESFIDIAAGAKPGWHEFDVTRMATRWVEDPLSNAGLLLSAEKADHASPPAVFASKESPDAAHRAQLVLTYQPALLELTEATGGTPRLVAGISKAMPLVNKLVTLRAKAPGWKEGELMFSFTDYPVNFPGKPTPIGKPIRARGEALVEQYWSPTQNGLHNILVEAKQGGRSRFRVWMRVPVLVRDMTFYGGYRRRRYINLLQSDDHRTYPYWRARGVRCVGWSLGTQGNLRGRKTTAEQYLASWEESRRRHSKGADGIMIDEMFGTPEDANCAEAIRRYRKQFPDRLICPYTTIVGKDAASAFKECADIVLIESYAYSPRAYTVRFDHRFNSAVKYGIASKSIASICAGDNYVTTHAEIRRQARYVRSLSPFVMPGVSIYSGIGNDALLPFFDRAIEDYWLGPVLFVGIKAGAASIRNIGQTDAGPCELVFLDKVGRQVGKPVPRAGWPAQGAATRVAMPKRAHALRVRGSAFPIHVVHEKEDYAAPPLGKTQPFSLSPVAQKFSERFTKPPPLKLTRNKDGFMQWAALEIPPSRGRSCTISFDIKFESIAIYGGMGVQAGTRADGFDRNVIRLDFHRSDDDNDISTGRTYFSYIRKQGERYQPTVHETMMRAIELNRVHRFFIHYEKENHVRALAKTGQKVVWDTGTMTLGPNALSIDELRFRVRPYEPSSITPESGVIRMGVSGPGTGGRTKVIVDNVRIEYMDD